MRDLLRRLLGKKDPIKYVTLALDAEVYEVLERMASRDGMGPEMWMANILTAQATPEQRERAVLEKQAEKAREAVFREMDRQDELDELIARAEAGEFTSEQWAEICRRFETRSSG